MFSFFEKFLYFGKFFLLLLIKKRDSHSSGIPFLNVNYEPVWLFFSSFKDNLPNPAWFHR